MWRFLGYIVNSFIRFFIFVFVKFKYLGIFYGGEGVRVRGGLGKEDILCVRLVFFFWKNKD